ncbi:MAG: isocitrate dehydrogenase (NADP(+)) [Deltaproteobacteria bacterium]|nr:isocitrate dehydrogenase (NADP(+)) [Deltaproteobacteria bacterium]
MSAASKITVDGDGSLSVPDHVTIPSVEGDGVGPDIWKASRAVFDAAVKKIYGGKRAVNWLETFAGEKAFKETGQWLPDATIESIRDYRVAIKGPLGTPIGGGIRSLNVAMRQFLDLYACVRPVRYYEGVPSPLRHPERVNMIIYRENTEDVYAGIEVRADSEEARELAQFIERRLGKSLVHGSAIGIKPMSKFASKRLMKMAMQHALQMKCPNVTIMHKGNIMKFTEGGFREWAYEEAQESFAGKFITEEELTKTGKSPSDFPGELIVKDRIADNMFQQIQTRPAEYSVIATTNLNGDYLSDALAAMVGGLGLAPGGNIGAGIALFEATHGTAPKYAGQDKVNPCSLVLSGKMMFDYLGWQEVGTAIDKAVEKTLADRIVTYDLAREMEGAKEVSCSAFGQELIKRL